MKDPEGNRDKESKTKSPEKDQNSPVMDEKIDLNLIIEHEKEERKAKNTSLKKTIKSIDNIFLTSLSQIDDKNMQSFMWQNFSIYSRKPGKDLSPLIVGTLALFTVYSAAVSHTLNGTPDNILDQTVRNSPISSNFTTTILFGLMLIIMDRIIYKLNPREWREQFDGKRIDKKPQDLAELHESIKSEINDGTLQSKIDWAKLRVRTDGGDLDDRVRKRLNKKS
jgi:hypothetical protein